MVRILSMYTYLIHSVAVPVGLSSESVEVSEALNGVDAICIIEQEIA